ncbi:MAG TPA: amidase family protein [Bryobacteraceae bacterium]|nr:amidase family protein [Bryobacteraceae bacterium]
MHDVLSLSGTQQARLIRERAISSRELVEAHLARIGEINPKLNAAIEILAEPALAAARDVDSGKVMGPLAGVPFSIKDSIEVAGTVCSAGTVGYRRREVSDKDATLVARLRGAGAIPLARTNLPDLLFAFESDNLIFGRTNNPYSVQRTSGGSSGGESALIAACGSPFGLGSDAAGSVRLPAHYCGITSIKPTSGRLARSGHVPPAGGWIETLWQIGPMARRIEDLWTMMPILLGTDGSDCTVIPMPFERRPGTLAGLRVAYFTDNGTLAAEPETAATVQAAARALSDVARVVEERRPPRIEESYPLEMEMLGSDGGDGLRNFLKDIGSRQTHPLLEGWLSKLEPCRTDLAGFAKFWDRLDRFRRDLYRFLNDFDVLVSPVSFSPAVPHGTSIADDVFPGYSYTMTHNLTGWPAAVVRCGQSSEGLPIGVQVAAAPWREDVALTVAEFLESACGGWQPAGL